MEIAVGASFATKRDRIYRATCKPFQLEIAIAIPQQNAVQANLPATNLQNDSRGNNTNNWPPLLG